MNSKQIDTFIANLIDDVQDTDAGLGRLLKQPRPVDGDALYECLATSARLRNVADALMAYSAAALCETVLAAHVRRASPP